MGPDSPTAYDFGSPEGALNDGQLSFEVTNQLDDAADCFDDDEDITFAGLPEVDTDMVDVTDQSCTASMMPNLDNDIEEIEKRIREPSAERYDSHSPEVTDELPTRELRPRTGQIHILSTWMDNDDSGDYDEAQDLRRERRRRIRVHRRPYTTRERVKETNAGPQLLACLRFKSEEFQSSFARLIATSDPVQTQSGYNLRSRNPAGGDDDDDIDLTGHPEARGCLGCFDLRIPCSLLEDEQAWPCRCCEQEDEFCVLLTPPVQKRACEDCKRLKKTCSFTYTRNHFDKCQDCVVAGRRCVAGPVQDFIRRRIRYPAPGEEAIVSSNKKLGKASVPDDCRECRAANRPCNYMGNVPVRACEACVTRYLPCTEPNAPLDPSPEPKIAPSVNSVIAPDTVKTRKSKLKSVLKAPSHKKVAVKHIRTKFFHPVAFGFESSAKEGDFCLFCDMPSFAFLGATPEPRQLTVYDAGNNSPYREVRKVHSSGHSTNVCLTCTLQRITTVMCSGHNMSQIRDKRHTDEEQMEAFNAILDGYVLNELSYCTICCSLADYKCVTRDDEMRDEDEPGCNLRLCSRCFGRWSKHYAGDLGKMLADIDNNQPMELGCVRADVEFLKEGGLLARHLTWVNSQP
jgi:hypothetical protein